MKTEELEKIGLDKEQIASVMKINGKDIEDLKKDNQTLTTERDSFKKQYEAAKETLDGFEGKDFDAITKDRDDWKKKAEDLEKEQKKATEAAELENAINAHVDGLTFKDEYRKRAYIEDLKKEGFQVKDGKLVGASEFQKSYDSDVFVDEKTKKLEGGKAKFTDKPKNNTGEGLTKDQILAMRDPAERQKAIKENIELFNS